MPDEPATHLYGGADDDNRQPPPENGMRGEGTARSARPDQVRHSGDLAIEEVSGIAAAEAAGLNAEREGEPG